MADWKKVNLRATEKNIPECGKNIVFRISNANSIIFSTGKVFFNSKKNCYEIENISGWGNYVAIKSGLIWCYAEDLESTARAVQ